MSRWKILESEELLKAGFFRLRRDRCEMPDGRVMPGYYVMEFTDWVNILPIDESGCVIAIEQFRHGSGHTHLEIPGGSLDPRADKEPLSAAKRELLEETGYVSDEWILCGSHYPNPALQNNRLHTFLALDCRYQQPPELDPYEDLKVSAFSVAQLQERLEKGDFSHSLITASITLTLPKLRELELIK